MKKNTLIRLEESPCAQRGRYNLVLQAEGEDQSVLLPFTIQASTEGNVHIDLSESKYAIYQVQKEAISLTNLPSLAGKRLSIRFSQSLCRLYHGWVTGFLLGEVKFAGQYILAGLCRQSEEIELDSLQNKMTSVVYKKETNTVSVQYDTIVDHEVISKTIADLAVDKSEDFIMIDLSKEPALKKVVTLSEKAFEGLSAITALRTQFGIKFPECFRWFPYRWWSCIRIKSLDFSACKHEIAYSSQPVEHKGNDYPQLDDVVIKPAVRLRKALYAVKSVAALCGLAAITMNVLPLCLASLVIPGVNIAALACFAVAAVLSATSRVVAAANRPNAPTETEEEYGGIPQLQKEPLVGRVLGGVLIAGEALTTIAAIALMALLCTPVLTPSLGVMMVITACTIAACCLSVGSRCYAACFKRSEGESMLMTPRKSKSKRVNFDDRVEP